MGATATDLNGRTYTKTYSSTAYTPEYNRCVVNYNTCIDNLNASLNEYNPLKEKVDSWDKYVPALESLKLYYESVQILTSSALNFFSNGGYICDGQPLRGAELTGILNSLSSVKSAVDIYEDVKLELDSLKEKLSNKKNNVIQAQNALRTASYALENTIKYKDM